MDDLEPRFGPYGAMEYEDDAEGRAICHFCGESYKQVGTHSLQSHGISSDEYREAVGLSQGFSLSSKGWMERQSRMMKERYERGEGTLPDPDEVRPLAIEGTRAKLRGRRQRASQIRAAKEAHLAYWSDPTHKQPSPPPRRNTEGQECPICGVLFTPIKYATSESTGRVLVSYRNRGDTCSEPCKLELAARSNRVVAENGKLQFTSESAKVYGARGREKAGKALSARAKKIRENTPHGTRNKYRFGCRCDRCRAANAQHSYEMRERRKA